MGATQWRKRTGRPFNRARYYDPGTGRWLSVDPLGFAAGDANLYRYVGNRATAATDPSGLVMQLVEDWLFPNFVAGYRPVQFQPLSSGSANWTRGVGGLKALGGVVEVAIGAGLVGAGALGEAPTVGASTVVVIAGVLVTAHGADTVNAGLTQVLTGQETATYTSRFAAYGLRQLGSGSPEFWGEVVDGLAGIVGTLGGSFVSKGLGGGAQVVGYLPGWWSAVMAGVSGGTPRLALQR